VPRNAEESESDIKKVEKENNVIWMRGYSVEQKVLSKFSLFSGFRAVNIKTRFEELEGSSQRHRVRIYAS